MSTVAVPLKSPALADSAATRSPDDQVWQLLCSCAVTELDPSMEGVRSTDLASRLMGLPRYRALEPKAAAYLWFVSETALPCAPG